MSWHYPPGEVAVLKPTACISDLDMARRAAAEVSKCQGYPMDRAYLQGDCDADADVQSALLAIRMVRQIESVTA